MATLEDFDLRVEVIDGPSREEMFDANRLVELGLTCSFTFRVTDESDPWLLYFFYPDGKLGKHIHAAHMELEAEVLSCEPRSADGKEWLVKLAIPVGMIDRKQDSTIFFTDRVQTRVLYRTNDRRGRPNDRRFVQKFMRYMDGWDESNPGGLWFCRWIARLPETVVT